MFSRTLLTVVVVVGLEASEMEEAGSVIHSLPPTSLHGPVSPFPFTSLYSPYPYLPYVKEFPGKHEEHDDHLLAAALSHHHPADPLLLPYHPDHHHHLPHHLPHHLEEYIPYQYDITKIPDCAYSNKQFYNISFCLQDEYYPVDTIKHELERNKPLVDRILSDITYQSADNTVDGLTKVEEQGYNYAHYYGNGAHKSYKDDFNGYSYSKDYFKDGGYLCPSDIFYGRPKRAANTYGKWKVIVNLPDEYYAKGFGVGYEKYTQTQRLEQCMYPGAPCSYLDPHYPSSCLQKHNFVRLLAYTYQEGLHIDSFKLPVACSCHLSATHPLTGYHYPPPPPYHHPSPTPYSPYGKK